MAQGTGNGFNPKSQRALMAAGVVAVVIIGAIDYYSPAEMSFAIFYLLPIMFVTWRGGNRAGVVIAIAGAVTWLVVDLAQATPGTEPFMYWNAMSGLFVFVVVVFLLAAVKSLNASLETKVEQRTGELQASFWELQQTDARLRTSEERFRQLAEGIHDVFWMTDIDNGQVVYVSPEYEKVWGRTCASWYESPGTRWEAVHPEDRDRVRRLAGNNASRDGYDEEYRIVRPDGEVRWVRERAFPIPDRTGKVYRLAGIVEDITSRKPLEERSGDAGGVSAESATTRPRRAG
ncbi:MAG TPA: PAS domain-containing protein [Verrucomicrobiae bacterium]|nr:PAS domain-containing protein [Verrucomicrobiae bacterium]